MRLLLALLLLASPAAAQPPPLDLDLTWRPQRVEGPLPGDLEACTAAFRKRGNGVGLTVAGGLAFGGGVAALISALVAQADSEEIRANSLGGLSAGLLTVGGAGLVAGPLTIAAANRRFVVHDCANLDFPRKPAPEDYSVSP